MWRAAALVVVLAVGQVGRIDAQIRLTGCEDDPTLCKEATGLFASHDPVDDMANPVWDGPRSEFANFSGGGSVGDFNGDGWQDVFVLAGGYGPDRLYLNNGDGTFAERAADAGVAARHRGFGSAVGDFYRNGWLDIFVSSHGPSQAAPAPGHHLLYRNLGPDGAAIGTPAVPRFVEIARQAGVHTTSADFATGTGATFGDYDLDGDLDLFVAAWSSLSGGNVLFRNEGGTQPTGSKAAAAAPRFVAVTGAAGLDLNEAFVFTPRLVDTDGDRCPELILTGDFGTSSYYRNQCDGTFALVTDNGTGLDGNGMGAAIADFNNDGRLDWFVTSIHSLSPRADSPGTGNFLYAQTEAHRFRDTDPARSSALVDGGWGWGAVAVDLDHDGRLDLVETNGWTGENRTGQAEWQGERSYVMRNLGRFRFAEVGETAGLRHRGEGRGILRFDYDNDGDQDLLIVNNRAAPSLIRNDLDLAAGRGHWLRVFLVGDDEEVAPNGVGARLELTSGAYRQVRYLDAGPGYLGTNELSAHFGVGRVERIDELRVLWPDGGETVLHDVQADQTLTLQASNRERGQRGR